MIYQQLKSAVAFFASGIALWLASAIVWSLDAAFLSDALLVLRMNLWAMASFGMVLSVLSFVLGGTNLVEAWKVLRKGPAE